MCVLNKRLLYNAKDKIFTFPLLPKQANVFSNAYHMIKQTHFNFSARDGDEPHRKTSQKLKDSGQYLLPNNDRRTASCMPCRTIVLAMCRMQQWLAFGGTETLLAKKPCLQLHTVCHESIVLEAMSLQGRTENAKSHTLQTGGLRWSRCLHSALQHAYHTVCPKTKELTRA